MKFEFELDADDTMLLYELFQSIRLKYLVSMLEDDKDPERHCRIPYTVDHINEVYDLEDIVFNSSHERMNLTYYIEKYGVAEYSEN